MTLINMLRPKHRQLLRRLRRRIANREHMRRAREDRKLCCVGVDLPSRPAPAGGWCTRSRSAASTARGAPLVADQARAERRRCRHHRHPRRPCIAARERGRHVRRPPRRPSRRSTSSSTSAIPVSVGKSPPFIGNQEATGAAATSSYASDRPSRPPFTSIDRQRPRDDEPVAAPACARATCISSGGR